MPGFLFVALHMPTQSPVASFSSRCLVFFELGDGLNHGTKQVFSKAVVEACCSTVGCPYVRFFGGGLPGKF